MEDEEHTWRLDIISIAGFAIPFQTSTEAQYQTQVQYTLQSNEIFFVQTLREHAFPCYLQLVLNPIVPADAAAQDGMSVLIPAHLIVNIVIADHGEYGQSVRFKFVPKERLTGVMRQVISNGKFGRLYGPNEDDPFHMLGMIKFKEISFRNGGNGTRALRTLKEWAECLKRNALVEYNHSIQILSEGLDGSWGYLGNEGDGLDGDDGMSEDGKVKSDESTSVEMNEHGEIDVPSPMAQIVVRDEHDLDNPGSEEEWMSERDHAREHSPTQSVEARTMDSRPTTPVAQDAVPISPPPSANSRDEYFSDKRDSSPFNHRNQSATPLPPEGRAPPTTTSRPPARQRRTSRPIFKPSYPNSLDQVARPRRPPYLQKRYPQPRFPPQNDFFSESLPLEARLSPEGPYNQPPTHNKYPYLTGQYHPYDKPHSQLGPPSQFSPPRHPPRSRNGAYGPRNCRPGSHQGEQPLQFRPPRKDRSSFSVFNHRSRPNFPIPFQFRPIPWRPPYDSYRPTNAEGNQRDADDRPMDRRFEPKRDADDGPMDKRFEPKKKKPFIERRD